MNDPFDCYASSNIPTQMVCICSSVLLDPLNLDQHNAIDDNIIAHKELLASRAHRTPKCTACRANIKQSEQKIKGCIA